MGITPLTFDGYAVKSVKLPHAQFNHYQDMSRPPYESVATGFPTQLCALHLRVGDLCVESPSRLRVRLSDSL